MHGAGQGDGFRLFPDVDRSGGGICASCGAYPDGFALLRWLFGWFFPDTLNRVADVLGLTDGPSPPVPPLMVARSGLPARACAPHPDQARARLSATTPWPLPETSFFLERYPSPPEAGEPLDHSDLLYTLAVQDRVTPETLAAINRRAGFDVFTFAYVL